MTARLLVSTISLASFALGVALLAETAPAAAQGTKPATVVVGYQTVAAPWAYGWKAGLFDKEMGVKTEWKEFSAGTDINAALASGSIAFGYLGSSPASLGLSQGLKFQVIFIPAVDRSEVILGRAAKGIKTLKDCAGHKLGTPFGSTSHYRVVSAIASLKLDKGKIALIDLPPKDLDAAWHRGDIDCASIWDPVTSDVEANGGEVLLDNGAMKKLGIVTADSWVVSDDFAAKHPDIVKGFVKAASDSVASYSRDKDKVQETVAKAFGVKLPDMKRTMDLLEYPTAKEQAGPDWLGTTDKKGDFAQVLHRSANFFHSINRLKTAPSRDVFEKAIAPQFLPANGG
jgi:taurine transport system substrate-binding protein